MLETIQEFAREQLVTSGEADAWRRRHARFYLVFAEVVAPHLRGAARRDWLAQLDAEQEDLRAALGWSQATPAEGETMVRLAAALFWFWLFRGYWTEGRGWLEAALAQPGARSPARVACLWGAGYLACSQGAEGPAQAHLAASVALARELADREGLGCALMAHARLLVRTPGQAATAAVCAAEGLALLRGLEDDWALAFGLQEFGDAALFTTSSEVDHETARQQIEESRRIFERLGDRWQLAETLVSLAAGLCCKNRGSLLQ